LERARVSFRRIAAPPPFTQGELPCGNSPWLNFELPLGGNRRREKGQAADGLLFRRGIALRQFPWPASELPLASLRFLFYSNGTLHIREGRYGYSGRNLFYAVKFKIGKADILF
jgi:hypothetical protein